ncbi:epoxyqueuosine reductase [Dysgonomonas sp. PH5-45]|uniref:tRNA epoxyqueuosine(34) reductase QueG n=1 Tax=unclassified Dysgonomonas TaxID=2630389 RepID=UPI0024745BCD|nr:MULTISPECIES: tRNA epoxyqueuosine(34) reductase QueG [unclassified Dysgonomonas]MDH6355324.1 epoxyqueuosine reductase [Dysgonomonas sp. PH5-45]MDH6388222.1 epoxyqueuosine reductase [Dysgonomonas sp. PH5-37]
MAELATTYSQTIKNLALASGFDACGICKAEPVGTEARLLMESWLKVGNQATMDYMERNLEKRCDPTLLVDNAKSIICLALNYYPPHLQPQDAPQFAYYAYGKDYHDVMKSRMQSLLTQIQDLIPDTRGCVFCDTAPLLERHWAAKAGLGFIGKNTMLIIPGKGSYYFLGEIIIDKELEYDAPVTKNLCGTCTRCMEACPTKAIEKPYLLNACKCISYQTIENKGEIDSSVIPFLGNRIYGCDACQQACPWNRCAHPHEVNEFIPNEKFRNLSFAQLENMSVEEYQEIFRKSAVKRAKYQGLRRNLEGIYKAKKGFEH